MKRSTERILTTHTGSLPRPEELIELIFARENKEEVDQDGFEESVTDAVQGIIEKQREIGVDVVNDGEQSKVSYATYIKDRLAGFDGVGEPSGGAADLLEFPGYTSHTMARTGQRALKRAACTGPISYSGIAELERDLANLRKAVGGETGQKEDAVFMSSASPGVIDVFMSNTFYKTHEEFIWALAQGMRTEYEAIANAGFVLQIDCPDLAMGRHSKYKDQSLEEFRKTAAMHVEALNWATQNIDPERMRIHLCWGNYEGPHNHDVPLEAMVDVILQARPNGLSLEGSNPRHEHEWKVWADTKLPDDKVIIPGVIDSTTNFIEHPDLVAQRITNYAKVVGRERVIAGTDCGFSTGAGNSAVYPPITWKKFESMAEGARRASKDLWG